jgi:hypothetical protein
VRATSVADRVLRAARRCNVQAIGKPATNAEDVMAPKQKWGDLSERSRKLILVAAVTEGCLKTAALIDIKRRPASQIRGAKWKWVLALIPGSFGLGSLAYFVFGRRR